MKEKSKKEEMLERIERTIADLIGCTDGEKIAAHRASLGSRIREIGQREHDWVFTNYEGGSPGTIISRDYMSAIDLAFPASEGEELQASECWQKVNGQLIKRHKVVLSLMPTQEEWEDRNFKSRHASAERISSKLRLYPSPYLDRATELLNSKSWAAIAAGLIALTGRRPTEIAWCGEFEPKDEYKLIFKGQLKKGKIESLTYEIPTLIDAETVLNGYHSLRNLQRNKTKILEIRDAREADRKTNSQINLAIRKHFSELIEPPADRKGKTNQISASNLRAAYGKIAAHFYCPLEVEPILYVGKILGHQCQGYETEALATTISYYTYYLVGSDGKPLEKSMNSQKSENSQDLSEQENLTLDIQETDSKGGINDLRDETNLSLKNVSENVSKSESVSTDTNKTDEYLKDKSEVNITREESREASNFGTTNLSDENQAETNNLTDGVENALSGTQLALRLNKSLPTIGRNRKKGDRHFASWSAKLDPDGVGWKYLFEGKLQSTGHDRSVDIYVPLSDVSEKARNRDESLILKGKELNRFQALASQLNFKGDRDEQLTQLFDWVESSLQKESVDVSKESVNNNVSKNDSDEKESTIITAIATIANFSENLSSTIAPLTNELKRVVDKLDNLPSATEGDRSPQVTAAPKHTEGTKTENPQNVKTDALEDRTTDLGTTEETSPRPQIMTIEDEDLKSTLDALDTAIAMKQAAIRKEKKKRSRIDEGAIATWEKEIESIARSLDRLGSLSDPSQG